MPAIHTKGKLNTGNGNIQTTQQDFFKVDGQPASVNGDNVSTHPGGGPHNFPTCKTANGLDWFKIDGKPTIVSGKADSCVIHTRGAGVPFFNIG